MFMEQLRIGKYTNNTEGVGCIKRLTEQFSKNVCRINFANNKKGNI